MCLFPASDSSPLLIVELDGLKTSPVMHVTGREEGKEEEEEKGEKESFLLSGAKVLKREFLARFANPEETTMNVLALVREEEDEGES